MTAHPVRIDTHLDQLLAARGLTPDWLNTDDGDPFSPPNIARGNLDRLGLVIPFHYRSALAELPELRAWVDALATTAREEQGDHLTATVMHGPSMLLLGMTGVGKTHQAFGAVRDTALCGSRATWTVTTSADLYAALRPRSGVDSETEFRKYRGARLLFVDDFGAAKPSEWNEEINFRLINWRYERHLPTLLTSNILPKELAARLGDRVASRLVEMCQRVVIEGRDRRRAA